MQRLAPGVDRSHETAELRELSHQALSASPLGDQEAVRQRACAASKAPA